MSRELVRTIFAIVFLVCALMATIVSFVVVISTPISLVPLGTVVLWFLVWALWED